MADKQEAEASVGKLLRSLVNDGFQSEPLEEYGKCRTSHTAAYDNDFGHVRFGRLSHASAHRSGFRRRGRDTLLVLENRFLGRRQGEGSKDGGSRIGSSIKGVSSLDPDIVGSGCFEALRCNDGMDTRLKSGPQTVSAEAPLSCFRLDCPETPLSSTWHGQKFRRFSTRHDLTSFPDITIQEAVSLTFEWNSLAT